MEDAFLVRRRTHPSYARAIRAARRLDRTSPKARLSSQFVRPDPAVARTVLCADPRRWRSPNLRTGDCAGYHAAGPATVPSPFGSQRPPYNPIPILKILLILSKKPSPAEAGQRKLKAGMRHCRRRQAGSLRVLRSLGEGRILRSIQSLLPPPLGPFVSNPAPPYGLPNSTRPPCGAVSPFALLMK